MMNKEEYKKELVRLWDSLRTKYIGLNYCEGVSCKYCPLGGFEGCNHALDSLDIYETVERWSNEHKKHKLSEFENDILFTALDHGTGDEKFSDYDLLMKLLKEGYYHGAKPSDKISDYIENCEVPGDN